MPRAPAIYRSSTGTSNSGETAANNSAAIRSNRFTSEDVSLGAKRCHASSWETKRQRFPTFTRGESATAVKVVMSLSTVSYDCPATSATIALSPSWFSSHWPMRVRATIEWGVEGEAQSGVGPPASSMSRRRMMGRRLAVLRASARAFASLRPIASSADTVSSLPSLGKVIPVPLGS